MKIKFDQSALNCTTTYLHKVYVIRTEDLYNFVFCVITDLILEAHPLHVLQNMHRSKQFWKFLSEVPNLTIVGVVSK